MSLGGKEGVFVEPTSVSETMQSENKEIEESTSVKIVDVAVPNSYIYEYDDYGNVISEFHGTVDKRLRSIISMSQLKKQIQVKQKPHSLLRLPAKEKLKVMTIILTFTKI